MLLGPGGGGGGLGGLGGGGFGGGTGQSVLFPLVTSCELLAAANSRNAQAEPEKAADGFDELGHRDRF
jgi:hypothetical protein